MSKKIKTSISTVAIVVAIIAVSAASHALHPSGDHHSPVAAPAVSGSAPAVSSSSAAPTSATASSSATTSEYSLIQEPAAGFRPVYDLLDSAKRSIDMTMYELEDPTAVQHLIAAKQRGVTVRVLLDKDFSGAKANAAAFSQLQAAGIDVQWAPAGFIFHQKTITIDDTVSAVGTANLTAQYYSTTRDAWVIDRNPAQVAAIESTFTADLGDPARPGISTQTAGLVWSPGAESTFVSTINAARTSVDFQSEELNDPAVVTALAQAAKRGVTCRILMTRSSEWYASYRTVTAAGCHVHVFPDSEKALYIHEKTIVADRTAIIIGSQNAANYSLTRNRELSLDLTGPTAQALIPAVEKVYQSDFVDSSQWTD